MMVLVTGGSSCGKSAFAEDLCLAFGGDAVYLAAMKPFGEEGAARVRKHRAQRAGKGFRTVECYEGLDAAVAEGGLDGTTVLLECLGNVVANEMFSGDEPVVSKRDQIEAADHILAGIGEIERRCRNLVVVGNEVGADGVRYAAETRAYQEVLGAVACRVAARSDFVFECMAGVPLAVKRGDAGRGDVGRLPLQACEGDPS